MTVVNKHLGEGGGVTLPPPISFFRRFQFKSVMTTSPLLSCSVIYFMKYLFQMREPWKQKPDFIPSAVTYSLAFVVSKVVSFRKKSEINSMKLLCVLNIQYRQHPPPPYTDDRTKSLRNAFNLSEYASEAYRRNTFRDRRPCTSACPCPGRQVIESGEN